MSILRSHKTTNYVAINNKVLEDRRVTWKAKGLLSFLLSKPAGWEVKVSHLIRQSPDKDTAVRTAINELIAAGYITRNTQTKEANGKFSAADYDVYEEPKVTPEKEVKSIPPAELAKSEKLNYNITEVFNHWNGTQTVGKKHLPRHRDLTNIAKSAIKKRLEKYTVVEIQTAIDNYATIALEPEYWYSYIFTVENFLNRAFEQFKDKEITFDNHRKTVPGFTESKVKQTPGDNYDD